MRVTRRQLAAALASAAALAQTPVPPVSPAAELQSARDQVKAIAKTLAEQEIPMSTEPAFAFQA
jgi:hypothetical protein